MELTQFLVLSVIIGLIAFSLLTVLKLNGWQRCEFCTAFWISAGLVLLYGAVFGFAYILIPLPFAAVAISHFINK